MPSSLDDRRLRATRATQLGILANAGLAIVKLVAGLVGGSYALVADAIESAADVVGSLIVWGGLAVSARDADEAFPFGYGKAEPLAAAVVGLILLGAGLAVALQAVDEIVTPHRSPAPWTLVVLLVVIATKELLARKIERVGTAVGSVAVRADALHHRSDALTSAAAAIGITVSVVGGEGWAVADDWAALAASAIIGWNGFGVLRPALADLMDRSPSAAIGARVVAVAQAVPEVRGIEKVRLRPSGLGVYVELHVEADPMMTLEKAHALGGLVRSTLRREIPEVLDVLVHMEPAGDGVVLDNVGPDERSHR